MPTALSDADWFVPLHSCASSSSLTDVIVATGLLLLPPIGVFIFTTMCLRHQFAYVAADSF
jgi:hypothetical protein|uniref:Uncharacterized protein n=1 Tax=Oryza sativa subsp. japonica TaxID=39947 RepID=Q84Z48_ORYSJ|nr:hypothetical protein [Oryza sativa Japonica Group]BAD31688.1 hypothetical protein [Oryza sativa Japonica Group]